jgi:mRNA interferase MazF
MYYISIPMNNGGEKKCRPGIIVSNDTLNERDGLLEVVYLTTHPGEDLPTHVSIRTCDKPSTAQCEAVYSITRSRVGNYCGTCTPEEMAAVDAALLISLGIELETKQAELAEQIEPTTVQFAVEVTKELVKASTERDVYKELCHKFFDKAVV